MISRAIYLISVVLMFYTSFFFYHRWKNPGTEAAISWDVSGYYWYLPSIFIYNDLRHQSFKDHILDKYKPTNNEFQQGVKCENGNYVMKYSSGMALMYFPFFIAAHFLAGPLGYPADGFSAPYQFAIQLGGFLVSILGLWYLRKLLLISYNDTVVAIVLFLLVVGSNYLIFTTIDAGMSHCWLFTVYVFLLLNTHYYYRDFKAKYALRIGLLVGLATLTRPTDILSCIIPVLWGMESVSFSAIQKRLALLMANYRSLLLAIICAGGVIFIQLAYWKYASGHWLFYSYVDQKLYFRSPNFFNYTFSYRSGWLVYAPIMVFAFIGIIPFLKWGKNRVAILSFFLLNYYVVCAWSVWWYGGRAMLQSYPVLLFPMAELVKFVLTRKLWLGLLIPVVAVFVYYNIWTIFGAGRLGFSAEMNKALFWRIVGRWKVPSYVVLLADNPDLFEGKPVNEQLIYKDDFAEDTGALYRPHKVGNGKTLTLDNDHRYSHYYKLPFRRANEQWLRAQARFTGTFKEWHVWYMAEFNISLLNKGALVKSHMIKVHRIMDPWESENISIFMKLPDQKFDSVYILFSNGGSEFPISVDSLKIWSFNEK